MSNAGYDVIIANIANIPVMETLRDFGATPGARLRGAREARGLKRFVEAALDAMSFEEFRAFAEYRQSVSI